jgi:hypothetical protein
MPQSSPFPIHLGDLMSMVDFGGSMNAEIISRFTASMIEMIDAMVGNQLSELDIDGRIKMAVEKEVEHQVVVAVDEAIESVDIDRLIERAVNGAVESAMDDMPDLKDLENKVEDLGEEMNKVEDRLCEIEDSSEIEELQREVAALKEQIEAQKIATASEGAAEVLAMIESMTFRLVRC